MTRLHCIAAALATTAAIIAVADPTHAAEQLPGVSGDHRIVKPLPEPVDGAPQDGDAIKIGDWDVRVSGSVTIDIRTGNLPPPRR